MSARGHTLREQEQFQLVTSFIITVIVIIANNAALYGVQSDRFFLANFCREVLGTM